MTVLGLDADLLLATELLLAETHFAVAVAHRQHVIGSGDIRAISAHLEVLDGVGRVLQQIGVGDGSRPARKNAN